ncbi:MAG: pyridoxamine 5-phosphate oxidase [Methylomonas sp.]|nr:MAG: pyridoxamine 5-phosphate oxidase [Methylomonas sp.]
MTDLERQSLQQACDDLITQHNSLLLASLSTDGKVDIGYAPYCRDEAGFYIFVSELAKHTPNLLSNPQASILFIEPEASATNPFARRRLTMDCQVQQISKTAPHYNHTLDALATKFGEIVSVLRSLPDFHLLLLKPQHGQFVAGFGKAFSVDAAGQLCFHSAS